MKVRSIMFYISHRNLFFKQNLSDFSNSPISLLPTMVIITRGLNDRIIASESAP